MWHPKELTNYKAIYELDVGALTHCINDSSSQGLMQGKIIASHTCFGGHVDVNG